MRDLERRIGRLEAQQGHPDAGQHHIPVLVMPWELFDDEEGTEAWLAEQCACDCGQCEGFKTVALLVTGKAPSSEAWSERVQAMAKRRAAEGAGTP